MEVDVLRQALIRLSQQRQLRDFATHNGLARSMAQRFVAGERLDEAITAVRAINRTGMSATLDHLGENVSSREEALEETKTCCEILRAIVGAGAECNLSLKLTQLGLDLGPELAMDNLERVLEVAAQCENFVRIDMESSEYVNRTLELFYRVWERHRNVGVVIQSCLYRSAADMEGLMRAGARVRLVKGAYLEPASVAFQRKAEVDANYARLSAILLSQGTYPALATHDESMIGAARQWADGHGIGQDRFEFQMLYGVRRDLQTALVRDGYRVRIYVPYGTHWYPYLMRRLAERPANVMFVLNNLAREATAPRSR